MGASAYARVVLGLDGAAAGSAPMVDLAVEKRNADFVRHLIERGLVTAVHDISEGGIACAAAEMVLASGTSLDLCAEINWPQPAGSAFKPPTKIPDVVTLFAEDQARYLVSVSAGQIDPLRAFAKKLGHEWMVTPIGFFEGDGFQFFADAGGKTCVPLATLRAAHEGWLPNYMNGQG
jgi:phosphoribosylformylglycinamidine synthase